MAELSDGSLYAARRYVKAAGGCSAPAVKNVAGGIPLGTMRFRDFAARPGTPEGMREAQLMIRHPNNSGMQMDQITALYIPAHFVKSVRIWQGPAELLAIESGISIAENPAFRFRFRPARGGGLPAPTHRTMKAGISPVTGPPPAAPERGRLRRASLAGSRRAIT